MNTLALNSRGADLAPDLPRAARALMAVAGGGIVLVGIVLALFPVTLPPVAAAPQAQRVTLSLDAFLPAQVDPQPEPEPVPEDIPRLTPESVLAAPVDDPVEPEARPVPAGGIEDETPAAEPPARRVYGVRKVYARGLGAGASGQSGLVTKRGNSLAGPPDSLVATAADLRGRLAPLSSVDQAPQPLDRRHPAYSAAMREARVSGTVQAWLLVDEEGRVRQVNVTEDIGADSRQVAAAALSRFRFRPARRDGAPVAVWILHRIRFQLQE